ncbi:MAG: phosphoglucosamine mutase [Thermoprotei archaeon]|nr:MAG: phosphoglucosamine mutase [Thermoprotei archaeon]
MGRLFGTDGVRGVVNRELTPEFVTRLALAIGTYFSGGEVLLGHDGRSSSVAYAGIVAGCLASCGCEVYNLGYTPTPTLQYLVKKHGFSGGVMVTASHNPPEYNGIKVISRFGIEIPREDERKIEDIFFEQRFTRVDYSKFGKVYSCSELIEDYIDDVVAKVDADLIAKRRFKVLLDCANGVASLTAPEVARRLGAKVISVNSHIDGTFPGRAPEPTPETLVSTAEMVKKLDVDFGVAYDGDGDRSIFIDRRGRVIWGDRSGTLLAMYLVDKGRRGPVVTAVSSSSLVEEILKKKGVDVVWTPVGAIYIAWKIVELNACCGFEENGGFLYPELVPVRDGTMTTALMMQMLADLNASLDELYDKLPSYVLLKTKVRLEPEKKVLVPKLIERLSAEFSEYKCITVDGIKVIMPDGWFLVRPSGTEPVLRIFIEFKTEDRLREIYDKVMKIIKEVLG